MATTWMQRRDSDGNDVGEPFPVQDTDATAVPDRFTLAEVDPPTPPTPAPTQEERLDAVEAKLDAVAQLAEQADATAQEVARKVRDTKGPG